MTQKKYILTADDVIDNLTSDLEDVPLSANQGRVLDTSKVNKFQGTQYAGKVLGIGDDGNVTPVEGGGGGGSAKSYTFTINKALAETSPTTCVTYSEGVTNAAEAYAVAYHWIRPTVVENGTLKYYLYRKNLSYMATDETGDTSSGKESSLDTNGTDVCASIVPLWWKVIENNSDRLTIRISEGPFEGAVTAHKFDGIIRRYIHVGMFLCPNITTVGESMGSRFRTYDKVRVSTAGYYFENTLENRGSTYGILSYLTWNLLRIIWTFASGSIDSQTTIGQDYTNSNNTAVTYPAFNDMKTCDGYTLSTKDDSTKSLMYLFVANPWGNAYQWVSGVLADKNADYIGIAIDQMHARGTFNGMISDIPPTWTKIPTPDLSSAAGYVKDVVGNNIGTFLCASVDGSSSTYFCDRAYIRQSSGGSLGWGVVGGYYNFTTMAGLFCDDISQYYSSSYSYVSARIQIMDIYPWEGE